MYASSIRASRTTISVSAYAISPTTIHVACSAARPPESRKIIAKPSPTSTAAVGNSAGSARGANTRVTTNAPAYPAAKIVTYSAKVAGS